MFQVGTFRQTSIGSSLLLTDSVTEKSKSTVFSPKYSVFFSPQNTLELDHMKLERLDNISKKIAFILSHSFQDVLKHTDCCM